MQNNGNDNDNNGPPLPPPVPVPPSYRCICGRTFTLRRNYLRHLQVHQVAAAPNNNVCERCQRTFTRADNLEYHRRTSCSSDPPPPAPWRNRLFRNTGPRQQQPSGSGLGSTHGRSMSIDIKQHSPMPISLGNCDSGEIMAVLIRPD